MGIGPASVAVIVTALAVFFGGLFGELILVPGLFTQGVSELILTMLLTTGDNFYSLPGGSHAVLAAVFYFVLIYFVLLVRARLGEG